MHHLHSAINTWLYCAPIHLSIYLIFDVFQSKLLVSVPLVPKHSGTFLLYFKFFMPFENFQSSPEVGAGNSEPSFGPCCSHFHGQSGVDSSNSLTGSVSLTDSRYFLSIYSLLTVCKSHLKPSVLQVTSAFTVKTFPSVDITFWPISPDGIMTVGHTGVL